MDLAAFIFSIALDSSTTDIAVWNCIAHEHATYTERLKRSKKTWKLQTTVKKRTTE
jgi:hypothetical protein